MKNRMTFLFLFVSIVCFSQQNIKTAIIQIDSSRVYDTFNIPYSSINIIDARFDKKKIGTIYNTVTPFGLSTRKYDAVFPDSLKNYLPVLLNTFLITNNSSDKLVILIKKFRMTDHLRFTASNEAGIELILKISASFYALRDQKYYKLFSIDNVALQNIGRVHEKKKLKYSEGTRGEALQKILIKVLQNKPWITDTTKNYFTLKNINDGMEKRFNLPVFSGVPINGIYKTFEEFKNNNPSITNFNVSSINNKIIISGDPNIDLKNCWGMCYEGKKYLFYKNLINELIPCDKSFKILSYRRIGELREKIETENEAPVYGLQSSVVTMPEGLKVSEYYDLDMDTGKLFMEEVYGTSTIANLITEKP